MPTGAVDVARMSEAICGGGASRFPDVIDARTARSSAPIINATSSVAFARHTGVDRSYLNEVESGKWPLPPSIIDALNLRVVYVPVG